jgi:hypothetical protein
MPPLPSPGQVVKLEYNYASDDAVATNIFHFAYSGAGSLSIGELAAFNSSTEIATNISAPYIGASLAATHGIDSFITDLSTDVGVTGVLAYDWVGTNTGSPMPASAAVCVSHEILRRYRGGHPRTYMMVGSASDYGVSSIKDWQTSFITNIQTGWSDFLAGFPLTISARTWTPVNVSYYETVGGVKTVRPTPLVDLIVAHVTRTRICSQRRRLGKIGG